MSERRILEYAKILLDERISEKTQIEKVHRASVWYISPHNDRMYECQIREFASNYGEVFRFGYAPEIDTLYLWSGDL